MSGATAVWFPRARAVELRDEEVRAPGHGEVRVRAIVSAISHGTEMLVYRGEVDPDLALDLPTLTGSYAFPVKYGYASVGRAVAVGSGVARVREDDLVFVLHPHQDEYVVPEVLAQPLPEATPPEAGVFLANLDTALNVVLDAKPRLGEVVAVFGQGVVGLLITQLLRLSGARAIAIEPSALRRSFAERCGAELALSPDDVSMLRTASGGRGVDIAIDATGDPSALQQAIDHVADEGTVVVCSWFGSKPVPLDLGSRFHRGRVRVVSSQVGRIDPSLSPRWDRSRRLGVAVDLLGQLVLSDLITHRIPLAQASTAYRLLDEDAGETVQVVLTYP